MTGLPDERDYARTPYDYLWAPEYLLSHHGLDGWRVVPGTTCVTTDRDGVSSFLYLMERAL